MNGSLLVTGASGFVGLNLLRLALSRGSSVVGLSARPIDAPILAALHALPGRFVELVGDVRDRTLLDAACHDQRVDRVVHLAAITASTERERVMAEEIVAVNLAGTAAVIGAAARLRARRFVFAGSIAVYGGEPVDGSLMDEATPHAPRTLYAITKSAGEAITARLAAVHGVDWLVGRIGRVFGPFEHDTGVRDTLSQIHQVTECAIRGEPVWFERPCLKNWSYAPDVASHLLTLAEAPSHVHRHYNLGTPHAWTLEAWCRRLRTRFADFRYHIGGERPDGFRAIDLGGDRDSGLLSWQRFADEFAPPPTTGFDDAFDGTMRARDVEPALR